jgi:hypothetical protein
VTKKRQVVPVVLQRMQIADSLARLVWEVRRKLPAATSAGSSLGSPATAPRELGGEGQGRAPAPS